LFGPKGETTGVVKMLMIVTFFAVGWLEVVSILFRPIALSFRLFGNIYAGESILEAMSTMIPWLSPILPIPFYFLEVLVGFVQALVFMLLTAVFTMLIAEPKNMILLILAEVGGSIHVGLAAMGVGIGIGLTGLGMTSAVGRNPGAFTQVLVHGILAIALTEAIVFYALYLVH
jgi:F0F1-type ATP synthase membrane subunit c/vacuolar-type H+-ATPase subunit K